MTIVYALITICVITTIVGYLRYLKMERIAKEMEEYCDDLDRRFPTKNRTYYHFKEWYDENKFTT